MAVPGVCGKKRSERKVLGYAHSLKPRRGCWPTHLHKGQKPWGTAAGVSMNEFCHSAEPEVARTV